MLNTLETYYWIGKLLAIDFYPATKKGILSDIQLGRINWNLFFQLCDTNLIIPAIYLKLFNNIILIDSTFLDL